MQTVCYVRFIVALKYAVVKLLFFYLKGFDKLTLGPLFKEKYFVLINCFYCRNDYYSFV